MKFSIRLILLIFLFASYGCVEESKEREVSNFELPAEEEDFEEAKFKWGYINKTGQVVIKDRFDDARNFKEGLAVIRKKGRWGYINKKGEEVIPAQFKAAWSFSGGVARILTFNNKMGFIDPKGNFTIEPKFDLVEDFHENFARFFELGAFGFINKT